MHVLIIPFARYVCEDSPIGCVFQHDQANALLREGIRVGVIAPASRSLRWFFKGLPKWPENIQFTIEDGIPVYRYQGWGWTAGRFPYLSIRLYVKIGLRLFNRYVAEQGMPDLIHAHNAWYAGGLAAQLNKQYRLPIVLTEHSSAYASGITKKTQIKEIEKALSSAQVRLMVSEALGRLVQSQFGLSAFPWECVPNILNVSFEKTELVCSSSKTNDTFCFLNIAFMTTNKNQALLLKAFAKAFKGNYAVKLHIGGDGPLKRKLEALSEKLGIKEQVVFLGLLNRNQVLTEVQSCDAFVLPSNYETFGVVLIEALACGRPVIASRGSGPDSIVQKDNGLLVQPENEEAFAEAMQYLHNNVNRYDPRVIRQDCLTRFGGRAVVKQLTAAYKHVCPSIAVRGSIIAAGSVVKSNYLCY